MSMKTEPFLSGKWGWDLGEGGWKDGADENFLKFAYMLNGNVDGFVSSLPSSPSNGTAYFLSTDTTLNARIDGSWYKFPVPKGFVVTEKTTGLKYEFNGSAFVSTISAADKVKLNGVATGATANSTDAALRDRSTHTGTQAIISVSGLQSALDAKAPSDSPTFTGTPTAPTPVGTDNSTKVATTAWVKSQGYSTVTPTVSSVAGRAGEVTLTKSDVGLSNADNTSDLNKPVSTATQTALDLKAPLASPTFTGTVVLPNTTSIGTVSSTKISYLLNVTSDIQAQIDSITGVSGGYAPINNPTFTGTVSGVTKAMVGLGNVDDTSDLNKPISTATQTALNSKQSSLNGTGFVKISGTSISYDNTSYAPITSPTFVSAVTVNAASGQSSIYLSQAGTNNGRIYANGGAGTDIVVESLRFTTLNAVNAVKLQFSGADTYLFSPTSFTLPSSTKIVGDFSNATVSSRTSVQTSTANGLTVFQLLPNGTGNYSEFSLNNNSDPTNASVGYLAINGTTDVRLVSTFRGTGSALPLNFVVGGSTRLSISTAGTLTAADSSGLAGLNASNIASGILSAARLPFAYSSANVANNVVQRDGSGNSYFNYVIANQFYIGGNGRLTSDGGAVFALSSASSTQARLNFYTSDAVFRGGLWTDSSGTVGLLSSTGNVPIYTNASDAVSISNGLTVGGSATINGGFSVGTGSGQKILYVNGGNSGTNSGSSIYFQQGGATSGAVGNISAILGGTYNSDFGVYTSSANLRFYVSGANYMTMASSGITSTIPITMPSAWISSATPVLQMMSTANPVGGMGNYISFKDNTAIEVGWIGYGAGTGEFGINNSNRNIRLLSPTIFDSSLKVNSAKTILYNAGVNNPTYDQCQLEIRSNGYSTEQPAISFHRFGLDAGVVTWTGSLFEFKGSSGGSSLAPIKASAYTAVGGSFSGDGSGLTGLNASSLTSGTVPSSRLTSATTSVAGIVQLGDGTTSSSSKAATESWVYSINAGLNSLSSNAVVQYKPQQLFQNLGTVSGSVSVSGGSGIHVVATVSGATTWTFPSPDNSNQVLAVTLELTNGGAYTMTWPSGTRWAGGVAPTLTASGTDILVFTKAGTNAWRGYLSSKDSK